MKQTELLKRHFDKGKSLTVLEAIEKFGIYALSQRCGDLRKEGYPVDGEMVPVGAGKRVMRYRKAGRDLLSRVHARR